MGDYRIGIMTGIDTLKSGSPEGVIERIRRGRKLSLDLLVGPEWSLTAERRWKLYAADRNRYGIPSNFSLIAQSPVSAFEPYDAGKALVAFLEWRTAIGLENSDSFVHDVVKGEINRFSDFFLKLPYSMTEASKLLRTVMKETGGSKMLVIPGSTMIYTDSGILYNYLPIFSDGKMVNHCFKVEDGGSSAFNIGFLRFMGEDKATRQHQFQRFNGIFYHDSLKFGVEICVDADIIHSNYHINDLDVQVLSSCGVPESKPAIRHGGYFVCSNATRTDTVASLFTHSMPTQPKDYVHNHAGLQIPVAEDSNGLKVFELPRPGNNHAVTRHVRYSENTSFEPGVICRSQKHIRGVRDGSKLLA